MSAVHVRTRTRTRTPAYATHVLLLCTRPDTVYAESLRLTHSQHHELCALAVDVRQDTRHVPIHWYTSKVRVVVHADTCVVTWNGSEVEWHTQLMCQRANVRGVL